MYGTGIDKNETKARALYKKASGIIPQIPSDHPLPIEMRIEISDDDVVSLEGMDFEKEDQCLDGLIRQISDCGDIASERDCYLFVYIVPHQDTSHLRILNVMDACFRSGVESPLFFVDAFPNRPRIRL